MTLRKFLPVAILFFIVKTSTAQINVPADSIKTMLCQKWEFKAMIMGGQRLTNMNESVTYEFLPEGTFKRISSNGKAERGTWTFETELKVIILKFKKTVLHIPSLSNDELIVSPGDGKGETNNSLGVGTVFKPAIE